MRERARLLCSVHQSRIPGARYIAIHIRRFLVVGAVSRRLGSRQVKTCPFQIPIKVPSWTCGKRQRAESWFRFYARYARPLSAMRAMHGSTRLTNSLVFTLVIVSSSSLKRRRQWTPNAFGATSKSPVQALVLILVKYGGLRTIAASQRLQPLVRFTSRTWWGSFPLFLSDESFSLNTLPTRQPVLTKTTLLIYHFRRKEGRTTFGWRR